MNKLIILLSLYFITNSFAFGQQKIHFSQGFEAQKTYKTTTVQSSATELTYSGSEDFLNALTLKGYKNPTLQNNESKSISTTKTGKLGANDEFPITITYDQIENNGEKSPLNPGSIIHGKCKKGKMPTLDSISNSGFSDDQKKMFLNALQSVINSANLGEREVGVGESFVINTPLSMPMGTANIDMEIVTTYKLLQVNHDLADFEINQTYSIKTSQTKMNLKASGAGKGFAVYDIANHINSKFEVNSSVMMNMRMNFADKELNMDLKMTNMMKMDIQLIN